MAARWCGKKDWGEAGRGEARPSPLYWVESCPAVPCVALASVFSCQLSPGRVSGSHGSLGLSR